MVSELLTRGKTPYQLEYSAYAQFPFLLFLQIPLISSYSDQNFSSTFLSDAIQHICNSVTLFYHCLFSILGSQDILIDF